MDFQLKSITKPTSTGSSPSAFLLPGVLEQGSRYEDRHAIAVGLQAELVRVRADRESASRLKAMGDVPRLQVGGVHITQGTKPLRCRENVVRGIGQELKK